MKTYILLFGITGDLSKRMLLPSLEFLLQNNKIDIEYMYGVSRRELNISEILNESLGSNSNTSTIKNKLSGVKLGDDIEDYRKFKSLINLQNNDQLLIYLSVPPTSAMSYVKLLGESGLNTNNIKLMLEKPFGTDLQSAKTFLNVINQFYNEEQVYKIDHYLAKKNSQMLIEYRK
jgi:glucose-6-phosphate 1-dehydrogenase